MTSGGIKETNIGPREQRRRLLFGLAMVTVAVTLVILQTTLGWARGWRLPTVLPFFAGMLGVLQAHTKT
jgi:hypothetical protein